MNQNEGYELARALAAAFREAATRHDEATKPKTHELAAPKRVAQTDYSINPPQGEEQAPGWVHRELARDYSAIANAIECHAAKETEA